MFFRLSKKLKGEAIMPFEIVIYALMLGWVGGVWVGNRPHYETDGWPDWPCIRCSIFLGAIGGWVMVLLLRDAFSQGFAETTVVALGGGILFSSASNLLQGLVGKRGAQTGTVAR